MKKLLLGALLASSTVLAATAPAPAPRDFPDLTSGRYSVKISGMLCSACVRAIIEELVLLQPVEDAKIDLEQDTLNLKISPGTTLAMSALRKALKRASKRANLGTQFEIQSVRYRP